jgi:hypothetical protein
MKQIINKLGPEGQLQITVADWLQLIAPWGEARSEFIWFHLANEGRRSRVAGEVLKRMGMRPGAPDLVFVKGWHVAFIELKSARGRQTATQRQFQSDCERIDVDYRVCRSLEEVAVALVDWDFLTEREVPDV